MINSVTLVGRVGKDPEVRHTQSGQAVANFSLATDESYKNHEGEKVKKTEWHNVVAWGKLAEVIQQYVKKGQLVAIIGKLQTRSWDDKQTGAKKYTTEIVAQTLKMLGGNGGGEQAQQAKPAGARPTQADKPAAAAKGGYKKPAAAATAATAPESDPFEVGDEGIPF